MSGSRTPEAKSKASLVPIERIAPPVLERIAEEFVLREGTDYGFTEKALSDKVQDVMQQLRSGEVVVVFDHDSESVTVCPKLEWLVQNGGGSECPL